MLSWQQMFNQVPWQIRKGASAYRAPDSDAARLAPERRWAALKRLLKQAGLPCESVQRPGEFGIALGVGMHGVAAQSGLGERIAHPPQPPALQAPASAPVYTHAAGDAYVDVDDATPR